MSANWILLPVDNYASQLDKSYHSVVSCALKVEDLSSDKKKSLNSVRNNEIYDICF